MFVVLRSGDKPKKIVSTEIKLDKPKVIQCDSPLGCLISIQVRIFTPNDSQAYPCALIDGADAEPVCETDQSCCTLHTVQQDGRLTHGPHTIQTVVRAVASGGTVSNWSIIYTIYEK